MDWLPHIVVKADKDAVPATAATALKTFSIGFSEHTATVHYVGTSTAQYKSSVRTGVLKVDISLSSMIIR